MKKKMKVIGLLLAAVVLVVASILGTMAYLTDEKEVMNTFTVGKVQITLDEEDLLGDVGDRTEEGNEYRLLPGLEYTKDPTVTVLKGSDESYVRMLITVSNVTLLQSFIGQGNAADWKEYVNLSDDWIYEDESYDLGTDSVTYEMRYKDPVDASLDDVKLPALFTTITVPEEITSDELEELVEKEFNVTFVAHAIQAAGFGGAGDAWAAFDTP